MRINIVLASGSARYTGAVYSTMLVIISTSTVLAVVVTVAIMAASALGVTVFYLLMSQAAEFVVESRFQESKIVPDVISTAPPVAAKVGQSSQQLAELVLTHIPPSLINSTACKLCCVYRW